MSIRDSFEQAIWRHQAGELSAAEGLYRQIVEMDPNHSDALNLLGVIKRQQGDLQDSERLISQAIEIDPQDLRYRFNLAETLRAAERFDEAIALYERVLQADEHHAPTWHALGMSLEQSGRQEQAVTAMRRAIAEDAHLVPARESLVAILWRQQQLQEAAAHSRQLIALAPPDAARLSRHSALMLAVSDVPAAIEGYSSAIQLRPQWMEPLIGLANCFFQLGQFLDSVKAARRAVELAPQSSRAHISLAVALERLGQIPEADRLLKKAAELDPTDPMTHGSRARPLLDRFQLDEAIQAARASMALAPDVPLWHSNLLVILNLVDGIDEHELFKEHLRWADRHAAPLAPAYPAVPREPDPQRPLRIGYVSPDFREHPVLCFFEPILDGHDRARYQPILYSNVAYPDAATQRLREKAGPDHWREIRRLSDPQVADLFQRDRLDILVDLAGHTADNRLAAIARGKVAVQATYLGYPNTTGIARSVLHYRLTDEFCDPPGAADELHSETLIRLPRSFLCFRPDSSSPDVAIAPFQSSGFITFGCFCTMMKITPRVIEAWSAVLRGVPNSRFVMKNKAMEDLDVRQRVTETFASHGIGAARLSLLGPNVSHAEHLAQYARLDVALDTFPYNGTTTTCEALWMGVAVVTWMGNTHRQRVGCSLLSNIGLGRFAARSLDQFIDISAELAAHPAQLLELRAGLRQRMGQSPLGLESEFVRNLEAAYRTMWKTAVAPLHTQAN